jgi:hypothetical protein
MPRIQMACLALIIKGMSRTDLKMKSVVVVIPAS